MSDNKNCNEKFKNWASYSNTFSNIFSTASKYIEEDSSNHFDKPIKSNSTTNITKEIDNVSKRINPKEINQSGLFNTKELPFKRQINSKSKISPIIQDFSKDVSFMTAKLSNKNEFSMKGVQQSNSAFTPNYLKSHPSLVSHLISKNIPNILQNSLPKSKRKREFISGENKNYKQAETQLSKLYSNSASKTNFNFLGETAFKQDPEKFNAKHKEYEPLLMSNYLGKINQKNDSADQNTTNESFAAIKNNEIKNNNEREYIKINKLNNAKLDNIELQKKTSNSSLSSNKTNPLNCNDANIDNEAKEFEEKVNPLLQKAINAWNSNEPEKAENQFCDALSFFYNKACKDSSKFQPLYLFQMAHILHSRGLISCRNNRPNAWRHFTRAYYIFLKLGIEKPEVYPILTSLAQLFINEDKQYKEAAHLLKQALKIFASRYSNRSWVFYNCLIDLLLLHCKAKNWHAAAGFAEQAIECQSKLIYSDEMSELRLKKTLSNIYEKCGRFERAYVINVDLLKILEQKYGKTHINVLKHLMDIAKLLESLGKYDKAEEILKRCVDGFSTNYGPNSPQAAVVMSSLATLYVTSGKLNEALEQLMNSLKIRLKSLGEHHFVSGENFFKISILHWAHCKYSEAESYMHKALSAYNLSLGSKNEITLHAKKILSEIQQRFSVRLDKPF